MYDNEIVNIFRICCDKSKSIDKKSIQSSINELVENSKFHHLAPLLLKSITNKRLIANKELIELRKISIQVIANYLEKRNFVKSICYKLERKGIKIILLKSMAFNDYLYTADAPRGATDIDILVNEHDFEEFVNILKGQNFLESYNKKRPFSNSHETTWYKRNLYIDVHRHLINPYKFYIDNKILFKRSKPHSYYKSENIRVLSLEDNMNHLALHFQNDCYAYHHSLIDSDFILMNMQEHSPNIDNEFIKVNRLFGWFRSNLIYGKQNSIFFKI